jgi:beta-glucanase (GH16 family)
LVLDEHFTNLSNWTIYEGLPSSPGEVGGYYAASHVVVESGNLMISGYRDPVYENKFATGGMSLKCAQKYGKWQVRMRAEQGHGVSLCLLLWNSDGSWPPEADFAEDNGAERNVIYGTYWNTLGASRGAAMPIDSTQWHVYEVEWTPTKLTYRIDGVEYFSATENLPTAPMVLCIQTQAWDVGSTNIWETLLDETTPATVNMYVDWVKVFSIS